MQWQRVRDDECDAVTGEFVGADTPGLSLPSSPLDEFSSLHTVAGRAAANAAARYRDSDSADLDDEQADGVFDPRQDELSASSTYNSFRISSRRCPRLCGAVNRFISLIPLPKLQSTQLISLATPNAISLCAGFALNLVNLAAIGHLGSSAALAGAALGNSLMNLTGNAITYGLCSSVDTLCAQSFGAGQKPLVGLVAQRAAVAYTVVFVPIIALWWNTESLLLASGQNPEISAIAGRYVRWAALVIVPTLYCDIAKRFLQAQAITRPQIWITLAANVVHAFLCWLLMFRWDMGLVGAPLALTLAELFMLFAFLLYIRGSPCIYRSTCPARFECGMLFKGWKQLYLLGVGGMLMLLIEWGSFELVSLASGWIGRLELDALVLLSSVTVLFFMVPLAISISASTLVGNSLGANRPDQARLFARAALSVAICYAAIELIVAAAVRGHLARLFTDDQEVLDSFASHAWYLIVLLPFDCIQCVQAGVMRGAGFQSLGAWTNALAYYCFGLPIGFALAFWKPLGPQGLTGLLVGLVLAVMCCAIVYTYKLRGVDWEAECANAMRRLEEERGGAESLGNQATEEEPDGGSGGGIVTLSSPTVEQEFFDSGSALESATPKLNERTYQSSPSSGHHAEAGIEMPAAAAANLHAALSSDADFELDTTDGLDEDRRREAELRVYPADTGVHVAAALSVAVPVAGTVSQHSLSRPAIPAVLAALPPPLADEVIDPNQAFHLSLRQAREM